MRASSIRKALPQDEKAIREIAEAAYGIYLERMDKKPAPMLEDYAARIAAGQAYALDDGKCVQAFMVLVPQDGERSEEHTSELQSLTPIRVLAMRTLNTERKTATGGCIFARPCKAV